MSDLGPLKRFGLTEVYTPPTRADGGHCVRPRSQRPPTRLVDQPVRLLLASGPSARCAEASVAAHLTYGYNADVAAFTGGAIVSHAKMLASNLAANRTVGALLNFLSFPPHRYLMLPHDVVEADRPGIATELLRSPDHLRVPLARRARCQARTDLLSQLVQREYQPPALRVYIDLWNPLSRHPT
jgi:hypothetical protein